MDERLTSQKFDSKLSRQLNTQIQAKPNSCFYNAIKALEFVQKADYVEGYILSSFSAEPYHHAWLELDGVIIDPSLPEGDHVYFFGGRRTEAEYLNIVERSTEQIKKAKKSGPPSLPDSVKRDIQPSLLEEILNPNYEEMLERSIRSKMSLMNDNKSVFDQVRKNALVFQKERNWPMERS